MTQDEVLTALWPTVALGIVGEMQREFARLVAAELPANAVAVTEHILNQHPEIADADRASFALAFGVLRNLAKLRVDSHVADLQAAEAIDKAGRQ